MKTHPRDSPEGPPLTWVSRPFTFPSVCLWPLSSLSTNNVKWCSVQNRHCLVDVHYPMQRTIHSFIHSRRKYLYGAFHVSLTAPDYTSSSDALIHAGRLQAPFYSLATLLSRPELGIRWNPRCFWRGTLPRRISLSYVYVLGFLTPNPYAIFTADL